MAKKSMIQRELKRERSVRKHLETRNLLRKSAVNMSLTPEERQEAMRKLHALPRNSSAVRLQSRCKVTGRPHGVYKKFGLCRNKLREYVMQGDLPGMKKASW